MNVFESLESFNAEPYELALLVPVLLNLKPASTITVEGHNLKKDDTIKLEKDIQTLGLKTKLVFSDIKFHQIHCALTQENLNNLLNAKNNYEWGIAYGYPLSAVEAASHGEFLPLSECPNLDEYIIQFRLSRKNWEEELKLTLLISTKNF